MDSLTHIALGACIGEAFYGKKLGKKAMFIGAVTQSIPDIDFVASFWEPLPESLLAHRGFTHSIMFCLLVTFLLSLVAHRWLRAHRIALWRWTLFLGTEMFIHIFLDAFNNYGVGWFEPFNHSRISFQTIFVADPFFSIWHAIAFTALIILRAGHPKRRYWWRFGIILSAFYLAYCVFNKIWITTTIKNELKNRQFAYDRLLTTPSPLNNWLWFVAVGTDSGYHVGYRSVLDDRPGIYLRFFPKNDSLVKGYINDRELDLLKRFSQGYYTMEKWNDTLVFNDLRFGQVIGWHDPRQKFAFHYFLGREGNQLVVQRGRFAKWDRHSLKSLIRRIAGDKAGN